MALHGSTSANLSPILFKGNNRSLGVNVIIHQDQSASMDNVSLFYSTGIFIGELQQALLSKKIGDDVRYPNLYSYFGVYSRNPSSSFTITNSNGSLSINQTFMRGLSTKETTISSWTNNYFNNSTSHIANICTNIINNTTGGRLSGFGNEIGGGSPKSEDIHGNIWSIFTTPNAISTQLPGRYGSVIGSNVRKGSTTIVITNSNEQENAPIQMINQLVSVNSTGTQTRSINGTLGEISFRNYRIIGLNSYDLGNYDGILFYGFTTNLPYGLVKFGLNNTYTIQRSAIYPTITTQSSFSGSELNQPTVILQSNTNSVLYDGSVTLTWNSFNATDVLSSGGFGFTNINTLSGSIVINNLKEDTAYSITVGNSVGSATASVQVNVGDQNKSVPTVNLSSPTESPEGYVYVNLNGSVTLNWTSTNATSVSSFTGTGFSPTTVSGSTTISNVNSDRTYTITVSGPGGTVKSNEIKVLVKSPTVNLSYTDFSDQFFTPLQINSGIFQNNQYVFVGGRSSIDSIKGKPYIFTSPDGESWNVISPITFNSLEANETLIDVTFDGNDFICIGESYNLSINVSTATIIRLSGNTRTYVSITSLNSSSVYLFDILVSIVFAAGEYVILASSYFYKSSNLTSWSRINLPSITNGIFLEYKKLRYFNGNFYLLVNYRNNSSVRTGLIYRSADLISWQIVYESTVPPQINNQGIEFSDITFNGTKFIAIGNANTNILGNISRQILVSDDGITWTSSYTNTSVLDGTHPKLYQVSSNGTNIVVTTTQGNQGLYLLYSGNNGTTWNSIPFTSLPLSRSANIPGSIAVNNSSKFILFSHDKTPSGYPTNNKLYDTLIFKSTGGSTWSDSITKLYYDIPDNTSNPITLPIESVPVDSLGRTFNITSSLSPISNINLTPYTFSTSTTDSNPGSGFIRVNSSFITQITEVYISNLNYFGINETEWYNTWDNNLQTGSPTSYGYLHINQQFSLKISSVTQQSGYYKISVFYNGTAQPTNPVNITNNSQIGIDFSTSINNQNKFSIFSNIDKFKITDSNQPSYVYRFSLNWSSLSATSVLSSSGNGFNPTSLSGSITVTPTTTTTYSITVQNSSGETSRATETIELPLLNSSSPTPTISLSSDKSSVGIGETFNLTWNSTKSTSVSSVTGLGFTAGATSGSTLVTAGINSTYRISVSGPSGIATSSSIPITINSPTVTLSSNKTSTDLNSPIKLTWNSTNATTVSSSIGIGFTPTEASGELLVYPTTNSTYRISVSGPSGIATSSSIPITINSPTVFFASSQDTIIPLGGTLALSWISTNANAITSFSGTGFTPTQVSGFAIITNITENRIYSITVSGPSGSVTASINVTVNASSNLSVSSTQLHDTLSLATESRGGIFSIDKVFINNITDNRIGFSSCLAEFIADTV